MNSSKSSIWIDKEFKPFYRENNKSGIALYYLGYEKNTIFQ